jgi:hypothetical protein
MEAVYDEPEMYDALALVSARCSQLVDDYSPGSDSKVVPLLIQHTLDQVASVFQAANIPHMKYIPPASATSATEMPVETVQDIIAALSLLPFIANHGQIAAALGRIQMDNYPASTPTKAKPEKGQKRPHQEIGKDAGAKGSTLSSDKRIHGGSTPASTSGPAKASQENRCCHDFFTTEGCSRPDCRYKHVLTIPPKLRERIQAWAARKGCVLRSSSSSS